MYDKLILWHNPRCSKSRAALALLQIRGLKPEIRLYLSSAPSRAELDALLDMTDTGPDALVRWKEARAEGLSRGATRAEILDALAANPKLIERPVLICGNRARIGRPPERILELL